MSEHNIVPKTIEALMKEFNSPKVIQGICEHGATVTPEWLRSAMQSLLQQVIEELPRQVMKNEIPDGLDQVNRVGFVSKAVGYNEAINECAAAIKSLQERI